MLYQLEQHRVSRRGEGFIAPNATLIGNVLLEEEASVWFGAVLRGDNEPIVIGAASNIQDNAVLHTDPGFPLRLGRGVTVGHQAMVHGCSVGDYSLIGIHSVILNGAVIGAYCLIGANALVTAGKVIPEGSLVLGSPAQVVRPLTADERTNLRCSAQRYVDNGRRYRQWLQPQEQPLLLPGNNE